MPHTLEIPDYVIERIIAKRGKLSVFDRFDPDKTALVVIDMQNFFVAEVETARSICPNINRLAERVRQLGGVVAWVLLTVADKMDGPSKWPIYHDHFFTPAKMKAHKDGLTEGSEGHKMYPELVVEDDDIVTRKSRFSAFIQGASDLDERLKERGIENSQERELRRRFFRMLSSSRLSRPSLEAPSLPVSRTLQTTTRLHVTSLAWRTC